MRILFLSTWFPYPPDNGAKARAYHLAQALMQRHEVTVVAFRPRTMWDNARRGSTIPAETYIVDADPFRYVNLPTIVKLVSPLPLSYWPSRAMSVTLARLRTASEWDAIVAVQIPVAQYAMWWRLPRVLDVDTGLAYQMRERARTGIGWTRLRALASWRKARCYEAHVVRRFHVATVASGYEVESLCSMLGRSHCQVATIANGVDTIYNRPGLADPCPSRLVYNGALTYSANFDAMRHFLAEIYPLVKRRIPDVTMVITGSTRNVDLSLLMLDDSVALTGYVDDIRIPVARAMACVVPLRQGSGTRIKILESMALGTPVVATPKGVEGLDLVDGEQCLIADSPEAFAEKTVSLLQQARLRSELSARARKFVEEKHDWQKIGLQFAGLVEDAVQRFSAAGRSGK